MPPLSVIFDDKVIVKDGVALHFEDEGVARFDAVVSAQGDEGLHAMQWDGTSGEVEYKDGSQNSAIDASRVAPYETAFDAEVEAIRQSQKTSFLALDPEEQARRRRGRLLAETDWWAMSDRTMTAAQTAYRQSLRDLPSTDAWNPAMSWDDETWTGDITGVTWPTKPE